jgi:hypothetical protein
MLGQWILMLIEAWAHNLMEVRNSGNGQETHEYMRTCDRCREEKSKCIDGDEDITRENQNKEYGK